MAAIVPVSIYEDGGRRFIELWSWDFRTVKAELSDYDTVFIQNNTHLHPIGYTTVARKLRGNKRLPKGATVYWCKNSQGTDKIGASVVWARSGQAFKDVVEPADRKLPIC